MAGGNDNGYAAGGSLDHRRHDLFSFVVGEGELLGIIREDADPVDLRVDQKVDDAPLTFEVEVAAVVKGRRRDWKHASIDWLCHLSFSNASVLCMVGMVCRPGSGSFAPLRMTIGENAIYPDCHPERSEGSTPPVSSRPTL